MNWFQLIREDFSVVFARDPATRSRFAVLTLHTGFWAVACYRMQLHEKNAWMLRSLLA